MTTRLLIPIIILQNHNRYNIMEKGHNYSIDIEAIEREVSYLIIKKFVCYLVSLVFWAVYNAVLGGFAIGNSFVVSYHNLKLFGVMTWLDLMTTVKMNHFYPFN